MDETTEIISELKETKAIGEIFMESGMFPDIKTQAQAVVKIMAGKEIGLTPFESMNALYIVNGKLSLTANAMATIVKKGGKYDYQVEKLDDQECSICFYKLNGDKVEMGKSTFTIKDAAKAEIINKVVWKNYPRNMLFARALSNGVKWFCPDASRGYQTAEEMSDVIDVPATKTITMDDKGVNDGKETTPTISK